MYKALYKIQNDCVNETTQEIFTPFINCYQIHSVTVYINGLALEQDIEFNFIDYKTKCTCGYSIGTRDSIIFEINYFYIRPDDIDVLGFLVDHTFSNQTKSKEIISKHYIEGQFSLDNGLYKNAVINFGITLEGILNKNLANTKLNNLINNYSGISDKDDMHFIRQLRNKVHPNQINLTQDITRKEAVEVRNKLETIMKNI